MRTRNLAMLWMVAVLAVGLSAPSEAGIVVYEEGDKKLEIGARIQLQFADVENSEGGSRDEVFFRRLRPYIQGTLTKDWMGKIEFDFGQAIDSNEVAVKDAYMAYSGWKNMNLYIGNTKAVSSREFLTSSKRQQQIERGFVGDHNLGVPDRQLGFRLDGHNDSKKITYGITLGGQNVDPDNRRIDFDTPVNDAEDWNQGPLVSGRLDFHPAGYMKFDQGDFQSDEFLYTVGIAGFTWSNDDDNNTYTDAGVCTDPDSKCDLDQADGYELSFGVRGRGLSIDGAYNVVNGTLIDRTVTNGVYTNGETELERPMLKAGYMFPVGDNFLEISSRWQEQDADNYQQAWEIIDFGLNYFLNKHDLKIQFLYTINDNVNGDPTNDFDILRLQWQFVF